LAAVFSWRLAPLRSRRAMAARAAATARRYKSCFWESTWGPGAGSAAASLSGSAWPPPAATGSTTAAAGASVTGDADAVTRAAVGVGPGAADAAGCGAGSDAAASTAFDGPTLAGAVLSGWEDSCAAITWEDWAAIDAGSSAGAFASGRVAEASEEADACFSDASAWPAAFSAFPAAICCCRS